MNGQNRSGQNRLPSSLGTTRWKEIVYHWIDHVHFVLGIGTPVALPAFGNCSIEVWTGLCSSET